VLNDNWGWKGLDFNWYKIDYKMILKSFRNVGYFASYGQKIIDLAIKIVFSGRFLCP
jgi:hypothetical protein